MSEAQNDSDPFREARIAEVKQKLEEVVVAGGLSEIAAHIVDLEIEGADIVDQNHALETEVNTLKQEKGTLEQEKRLAENLVEGVIKRFETVAERTLTDALTGLKNRRGLETEYRSIAGASRMHRRRHEKDAEIKPASMLVIDVDKFKSVNDLHGHIAGDRVLVGIAEKFTRRLRKDDTAGRLGGDEFMIILPHTNKEEAALVAEELRKDVEADDTLFGVTLSIGLDEIDPYASELDRGYSRADAALYEAKSSGGNRVELATKRNLDQ